MRLRVLPYKRGSKSARAISQATGIIKLKTEGSGFTARGGDVVLNWGSSVAPDRLKFATFINDPAFVADVSDKLAFFKTFWDKNPDRMPEYWTDPADIPTTSYPIMCRTILDGHSGQGIVVANTPEELVPAPLYTAYVKKKDEYRVHVGRGEVIAVQRKGRRVATPDSDVNWKIRNHANGFVFVRNNLNTPQVVIDAAIEVVGSTHLDFGAADVVYYEKGRGYGANVLEVNSAPGVEGTTVEDYAKFFKKIGVSNA